MEGHKETPHSSSPDLEASLGRIPETPWYIEDHAQAKGNPPREKMPESTKAPQK